MFLEKTNPRKFANDLQIFGDDVSLFYAYKAQISKQNQGKHEMVPLRGHYRASSGWENHTRSGYDSIYERRVYVP